MKQGVAQGLWCRGCGRGGVVEGVWQRGCSRGGTVEEVLRRSTCKQSLGSGLFIASGAIELATKEEALDGLGLQGGVALVCREVVILHSIRRPQHLALLKACTTTPRAEH